MLHAIAWAIACACVGFVARALTTRLLHWLCGRLTREKSDRTWRLTLGPWVLTVGLSREQAATPEKEG